MKISVIQIGIANCVSRLGIASRESDEETIEIETLSVISREKVVLTKGNISGKFNRETVELWICSHNCIT
jgi:hypothetical protein